MGIFDGISKSISQQRYESIKEKANLVKQGEISRCRAMFNELWNGLTITQAQEVLDLFGAEAKALFLYHSAWQTFLQTIDPAYEWLTPPYNVTINEDGTVTLSEKEIV